MFKAYICRIAISFFSLIAFAVSSSVLLAQNLNDLESNFEIIIETYGDDLAQADYVSYEFKTPNGKVVDGTIFLINDGANKGLYVWELDSTYAGTASTWREAKKELKGAWKLLRSQLRGGDKEILRETKDEYKMRMRSLRQQHRKERKDRKKIEQEDASVFIPTDNEGNPLPNIGCDLPGARC